MKKMTLSISLLGLFLFSGCGELQNIINSTTNESTTETSSFNIANGLKEALELGVNNGVELLSKENGYFNDPIAKILLPAELQKVDATLRKIGLSSLADQGLKVLNQAAESAVSEAKPIFISAIKNMTINDAMNILKGNDLAATSYLKDNTYSAIKATFQPKIQESLSRVGADKIWQNIINRYNQIPLVTPVEANLTSYVTEQAINGLFSKIGDKEKDIRSNINARTTSLLKSVFALQD